MVKRSSQKDRMEDYADAGRELADLVLLASRMHARAHSDDDRTVVMTILCVAIMSVLERTWRPEDIPGVVDHIHRSLQGSLELIQKQSTQPPESVKH